MSITVNDQDLVSMMHTRGSSVRLSGSKCGSGLAGKPSHWRSDDGELEIALGTKTRQVNHWRTRHQGALALQVRLLTLSSSESSGRLNVGLSQVFPEEDSI
jgi:hypothetical protein